MICSTSFNLFVFTVAYTSLTYLSHRLIPLGFVASPFLNLCVAVSGRKVDTGEPIIMYADYLFIKRVSEEKFSRLVDHECRLLSRLIFVFQDVSSHSNF